MSMSKGWLDWTSWFTGDSLPRFNLGTVPGEH